MKIVFLDRDGTVIVDPTDERVDTIEKIELFPDTLDALKYLADNDFAVILITNQAAIAEGRINEGEFQIIHDQALKMLEPSGITILKTYMCPHAPDDGCECRKPKATMLLRAAQEFNVDLSDTYMVGDRQSDILAGVNAGMKTVLVKTANMPVASEEATYTAANLLDAMHYIANH